METAKTIDEIIEKSNRDSKNHYYKTTWITFVGLSFIVLYVFIRHNSQSSINGWLYFNLLVFGTVAFTVFYFWLTVNTPRKNYWMLRKLILIEFPGKSHYFNSYILTLLMRTFISFVITITLISSGLIISHACLKTELPGSLLGLTIVYYTIVILFVYLVIALPRMIALKINKDKYIHLYWMHFIKSVLVNSPLYLYFSHFLFIVISLIIIGFTFTKDFKLSNFFDREVYGIAVAILSIWLSTMMVLINDFLKNYLGIYRCYESYTTHILREKIIETKHVQHILIGFGNLGRIVGGHLVAQLLDSYKNKVIKNKSALALFECIIGRDFNIRVIPRSIIVIEKDSGLFEETRIDTNSGLTYGFANGKDLIFEWKGGTTLPANLAIFCLNGDGGYLPILQLADFGTSNVIINTTSDRDMGYRLKVLVDREVKEIKKPFIITTVEDSGTYSFLEKNKKVTVFPLHTGIIEGNSVANRLFTIFMKVANNPNEENGNIRFYFVGTGKTMYYTLFLFAKLLKQIYQSTEVINLLERKVIVITNDEELISESISLNTTEEKEESFPHRYIWTVNLEGEDPVRIPLVFHEPSGFHPLFNAVKWVKEMSSSQNEFKKLEHLFIFTTKNSHDGIRISQHIRQIAEIMNIRKAGILASVSIEIFDEIKNLLADFKPLQLFLANNKGFPRQINDVILKKNLIISSQITSISDCLRNKNYYDIRKSNNQTIRENEDLPVIGEIVFCTPNQPGAFCQLLTYLSGLGKPVLPNDRQYFPSFYNNYTYKLYKNSKVFENTFVFRGDAFLDFAIVSEFDEFFMDGYALNGTQSFQKEIKLLLEDTLKGHLGAQSNCAYNTRCPISSNSGDCLAGKYPHSEKTYTNAATIKILANYDSLSGSLAVMLADFLMIGEQLRFSQKQHSQNKNIDLVYENCLLCENKDKAISRLYINYKNSVTQEKMDNLLARRNIIGLKIKPVNYKDKEWQNYAINLKKYLENISSRKFSMINKDTEITLFDDNADSELLLFIKDGL